MKTCCIWSCGGVYFSSFCLERFRACFDQGHTVEMTWCQFFLWPLITAWHALHSASWKPVSLLKMLLPWRHPWCKVKLCAQDLEDETLHRRETRVLNGLDTRVKSSLRPGSSSCPRQHCRTEIVNLPQIPDLQKSWAKPALVCFKPLKFGSFVS